MALIRELRGHSPQVADDVFVAETATLIGDVSVGEGSSIWYGAVLRGAVGGVRRGRWGGAEARLRPRVAGALV